MSFLLKRSAQSRWRALSLRAKLLVPLVAVMLASLLVSSAIYIISTARTRNQLVEQEMRADMARVTSRLQSRLDDLRVSSRLLANDSTLALSLDSASEGSLATVNAHALAIRDRMTLDVVQVYDATGEMHTNILSASLYRQSLLLPESKQDGVSLISTQHGVLLVSRDTISDNQGVVLAGIDLFSEVRRIVADSRMLSEVGVQVGEHSLGTRQEMSFGAGSGPNGDLYVSSQEIDLAGTTVTVLLERPIDDVRRVTTAGLAVIVFTSLATTLLVILLAVLVTRASTRPIARLARMAQQITSGEMDNDTDLALLAEEGDDPGQDEIRLLARAIADMVGELRGLHAGLETQVQERTRALAETEERYRSLVEEDLAGIVVVDPDGTISTCNPAIVGIFGLRTEQDATTNLGSLYQDPEDWGSICALVQRQGRLSSSLEMKTTCGDMLHIQQHLVGEFDERGELIEIKGYYLDNTERQRLEEQLRQSQKMEAVGRLAGGVAHDFNNLLTVILGYSEMLLDHGNVADEFGYKEEVLAIRQAGERAATLTRQLLAFSRKQVLQPSVLNLNTVIDDLTRMLQRLIGEDITLNTNLCPELGSVSADPGQIEQVIMNLAVNGRDAMPQGGRLTIKTDMVYPDSAYAKEHPEVQPGQYAMVAVSDDGIGMNEQTKRLVFEPFFTTKAQGTGLGLSTVYGIVKQSGGHITVESEVGIGSCFRVILPCVDGVLVEEVLDTQREPDLYGDETVLLVEDESMVRALCSETLRQHGYRLLEAANGFEALAMARSFDGEIDLLVTDVVMPHMSGSELAKRLTAQRPHLKILYMSGYTDSALGNHGIVNEDIEFLQKPFSPLSLAMRIREITAMPHGKPTQ